MIVTFVRNLSAMEHDQTVGFEQRERGRQRRRACVDTFEFQLIQLAQIARQRHRRRRARHVGGWQQFANVAEAHSLNGRFRQLARVTCLADGRNFRHHLASSIGSALFYSLR